MDHGTSDQALEILLSRYEIEQRLGKLAAEITKDYQGRIPHLVGILKGAWVFMADLIRHMDIELTVDFLGIASYNSGAHSSGEVRITKDLDTAIKGREVLIVEDILDTGRTLKYLEEVLSVHKPHNLRVATLLNKRSRRIVPIKADYVGFEIADVFVVGYGLDFDQKYRQLPDIHVLRAEHSR
jgi:hypoxanthine phosphoribosyltransferase